jgi:hypothetical protein
MQNNSVYVARELIQNYNSSNVWYKSTGAEIYNTMCLNILKQVDQLSEEARNIFHENTKVSTQKF